MTDSYDEDEALKKAIAASLEENRPIAQTAASKSSEIEIIDLTTDDSDSPPPRSPINDPDLLRAIAHCLQKQSSAIANLSPDSKAKARQTYFAKKLSMDKFRSPDTPAVSSVLGINRKQQEKERLERLERKRKIEELSPITSSEAKRKAVDVRDSGTSKKVDTTKVASETTTLASPSSSLPFPDGAIKKTWVFGCPRENDLRFEEVVEKQDLELAVLSSFQWDYEWLFTKFEIRKTRFLLVMGAKSDDQKKQIEEDFKGLPTVRLSFVPMAPQVNCMHSKLMLLFYPERLRVVVPSANLVPYDWGEGGVMENIMFLIDLPRKDSASEEKPPTPFLEELRYFLKASNLHEKIIEKLSGFDFNKTAKFAFVHTIGGSHYVPEQRRTGICGLGTTISSLGLCTTQNLKLDYVASSIGALSNQFMHVIYLAAQGDDGQKALASKTSKSSSSETLGVTFNETDGDEWKDNFLIYYPSSKTVKSSKARSAGTICFQSKWYNQANFPRHAMRDNLSLRDRVLMHSKILFVRPKNGNIVNTKTNATYRGWVYVGSANLSESAWGRLIVDRSNRPKLNCRNWECGVIVPIEHEGSGNCVEEDGEMDLYQVFGNTVPVPMKFPAPEYGPKNNPWYHLE